MSADFNGDSLTLDYEPVLHVSFDLTPVAPPPAAIAHVQDTPLTLISSASGTITFPAATTVGNTVVLFMDVAANLVVSTPPGVSGGGVGTWTAITFPTSTPFGADCNVIIWYGLVTGPGSATISVADPSGFFWGAGASEFSGVNPSSLVDHVCYGTDNQTTIPVGPLHPSAVGQLAFIGNGTTNGVANPPYTAGAPWTMGTPLAISPGPGAFGNTDWLITTSTATLNATYSYNASTTQQGVAGVILGHA